MNKNFFDNDNFANLNDDFNNLAAGIKDAFEDNAKNIKDFVDDYTEQAKVLLKDTDKIDALLLKLELKLRTIPRIGNKLGDVVVLASMIKAYIHKEYTDIPRGTLIALVAAVLYVVSSIDFMPDFLPGLGLLDDAAIVAFTVENALKDIDAFKQWQKDTGRR